MSSGSRLATAMVCAGCGERLAPFEPWCFICPRAGSDDIDHVLRRVLAAPEALGIGDSRALFLSNEANPFRRYRRLFHSYHVAAARGLGDGAYLELVDRLDRRIARVDGLEAGFRETPFAPNQALAGAIDLRAEALWIKDETGNVAGSHKARHMMGLMVWLEVARRTGLPGAAAPARPLAIASCGNAGLAAAVVAAAAERSLEVFVPPHVDAGLARRMEGLGAHLHSCPRRPGESGDPCFLRFLEALGEGAVPFTCQGSTNGLSIEGGLTLAWEMVSELLRRGRSLDRLLVQVGGGALASACIQGFREAGELGLPVPMPVIHAVQTRGAYPLARAWRRLIERLLGDSKGTDADLARRALALPATDREAALRHAAHHRSDYMRPWQEEPRSVAGGILDDETYDWLAVVTGMLETGGFPLLADEGTLRRAHRLARASTTIAVDPTGTAGLAGLLQLQRHTDLKGESIGLLFTGRARSSG